MAALESLRSAHPELSEWCNTLSDLFQRKQWRLLTLNLQHFLSLPIFQAGDELIQLYHDFITLFEFNINLLSLAHFAVIVSLQYAHKDSAIAYLQGLIQKLRDHTTKTCIEQPILYVKMQIALFKLQQGNGKECGELVQEAKTLLRGITDIDPSVYASYQSVSSQYHKWREGNEPLDKNEGLGLEVGLHKDGDAEPIGNIIKRLRSRNRRGVNAGNEGNGGEGEMMTLSEMQMLAKNEYNQGRKKLKAKSKLGGIVDNGSDKQKDRDGESGGERKEIEHEEQIEEDIGSQKQMGKMERGYETAAKMQISPMIKVYQRRTKLKETDKPLSLKQKENGREKEKEDSHEEKENGHKDVGKDGGTQKEIDARVGGKGKEPDMEEEEKSDEKLDIEKKSKENEHEDAGGQNQFSEEENETLANMQMFAKKKLNKGRKKLKQGKEEEHKDERENACSQEQVEEEVDLEKENGLEEEVISVRKRSGTEFLDQREENVGRKKQMDEKEGEEVTLAEMRMSAKKKLNQERTELKDKDKLPRVKEKRQDKDEKRGKDNEQKNEEEGSCTQKDIAEQDGGEDEKENDIEEVAAVKMKRKRGRYRIPEVDCLVVGSRTREQRDRRKTLKSESLEVAKRREALAKEIEMEDEDELYDEEEMVIMNLRKKRARRKPAELCSLEVIKSASKTWNSDAETNESNLEIVSVKDFDFYDFNKDRIGRKFQKGQVWAIYDDKDGMPRHYAVIDEVVSVNPFHVQLNWLDIQDNEDKASISREKMALQVACGSFKVSLSVTIKSRKIFSHIADFERAARELYKIYPKKGSVWAMFNKDALGAGGLNITTEKGSCYDIVVFLTSYSEVYGLSMAYLERVDGFKSVYKRKEIGAHAIKILEGDDFRLFSHHIPARKLSGEEVSGLPKDCWELDPASLPESLAIGYEI